MYYSRKHILTSETINRTPSKERIGLCFDATYEIDKLARVLPGMVPLDEDQAHYAVRAIAGRLLRLTHVLMSALGDDMETVADMRAILFLDTAAGQG